MSLFDRQRSKNMWWLSHCSRCLISYHETVMLTFHNMMHIFYFNDYLVIPIRLQSCNLNNHFGHTNKDNDINTNKHCLLICQFEHLTPINLFKQSHPSNCKLVVKSEKHKTTIYFSSLKTHIWEKLVSASHKL